MSANQPEFNADPAQLDPQLGRGTGVGIQWLNLALSIEEQQYVLVIG